MKKSMKLFLVAGILAFNAMYVGKVFAFPYGEHGKQAECPVCLGEMDEPRGVVTTACEHKYHAGCFGRWHAEKEEPSCPMCRATDDFSLDPENLEGANWLMVKVQENDFEKDGEALIVAIMENDVADVASSLEIFNRTKWYLENVRYGLRLFAQKAQEQYRSGATTSNGQTALELAKEKGNPIIIRMLEEAGFTK